MALKAYCIGEKKMCSLKGTEMLSVKLKGGRYLEIQHGSCSGCKHPAYRIIKNYELKPYCIGEKKLCSFTKAPQITKKHLANGRTLDIAHGKCRGCKHEAYAIIRNYKTTAADLKEVEKQVKAQYKGYCLAEKKVCDMKNPKKITRKLPNGNKVEILIGACSGCKHDVARIIRNYNPKSKAQVKK